MNTDHSLQDDTTNLRFVTEQLESAIVLARRQGFSVVTGLLIMALEEAKKQLKSDR